MRATSSALPTRPASSIITQLRPISVLFTLPQQQLSEVTRALGQGRARRRVFGADNKTVIDNGTLQVVDNQVDQTTGTMKLKAEFPNAKLQLWPGQFVNVGCWSKRSKGGGGADLGRAARPERDFQLRHRRRQRGDREPVTVTQQNENDAVVSSGLSPSDRVVTTGFANLSAGAKVVIGKDDAAPSADPRRASAAARPTPKGGPARMASAAAVSAVDARGLIEKSRLQAGARAATKAYRNPSNERAVMSVSTPFIRRPIATSLLGFAVCFGGRLGYWALPVSSLPQVDFPTIQVTTQLPGASPDTIAALVTAPLERQFGQIPSLSVMTRRARSASARSRCSSISTVTSTAPRRTCRRRSTRPAGSLPKNLPYPPTYSKVNPADAPVMTLALTSETDSAARSSAISPTPLMAQRLSRGIRRRPGLGAGGMQSGGAGAGRSDPACRLWHLNRGD